MLNLLPCPHSPRSRLSTLQLHEQSRHSHLPLFPDTFKFNSENKGLCSQNSKLLRSYSKKINKAVLIFCISIFDFLSMLQHYFKSMYLYIFFNVFLHSYHVLKVNTEETGRLNKHNRTDSHRFTFVFGKVLVKIQLSYCIRSLISFWFAVIMT